MNDKQFAQLIHELGCIKMELQAIKREVTDNRVSARSTKENVVVTKEMWNFLMKKDEKKDNG